MDTRPDEGFQSLPPRRGAFIVVFNCGFCIAYYQEASELLDRVRLKSKYS
jgi:hypothetical protein